MLVLGRFKCHHAGGRKCWPVLFSAGCKLGKRAVFLPLDSEPNICDIGRRVKCSLGSPERQTGVSWMSDVWAVEWDLGMHWV